MSALKSSSEGRTCWATLGGSEGVGDVAMLVSGPEVSLLDASLAEVLFDGSESREELLEDDLDSEQLAEMDG